MARIEQLAALLEKSSRAAVASEQAPAALVEHRPGWTATDPTGHLVQVQWFWSDVCERAVVTGDGLLPPPPTLPGGVAAPDWLQTQTSRMLEALRPLDPDARRWTWFDDDQTARFILRRQTIEAMIHCFDAEHAAGLAWTASPDGVELGLDESVEVMQRDRRDGFALAPLALEPIDSNWRASLFAETPGEPVRLALPAADMLLALRGRHPIGPDAARLIAAVDLDRASTAAVRDAHGRRPVQSSRP